MSIVPESHQFVRPGQVAPHLPAPDNCMVCALPEAAHDPSRGYAEEAAAHDQILHDRLAEIRGRQEAGEITVREAADLRIVALQHHIDATAALRAEYFGNGE